MTRGRESINLFELFELVRDLKKDISAFVDVLANVPFRDLRTDVKELIKIGQELTKPENLRTFREFVNELRILNRNLESFKKDIDELKESLKTLDEIIATLREG